MFDTFGGGCPALFLPLWLFFLILMLLVFLLLILFSSLLLLFYQRHYGCRILTLIYSVFLRLMRGRIETDPGCKKSLKLDKNSLKVNIVTIFCAKIGYTIYSGEFLCWNLFLNCKIFLKLTSLASIDFDLDDRKSLGSGSRRSPVSIHIIAGNLPSSQS